MSALNLLQTLVLPAQTAPPSALVPRLAAQRWPAREPEPPGGRDPAAWVWRAVVPPDGDAAPAARAMIGAALVDAGLGWLARAAVTGAVALVEYAVQHGQWSESDLTRPVLPVTVEIAEAYVIIEVFDQGRYIPGVERFEVLMEQWNEFGCVVRPSARVLWFAVHI
jgi:hypothetical protein